METYECLCCGFVAEFRTAKAAYEIGWDVLPYFTLQPFCDLCPSSPIAIDGLEVGRKRHAPIHEKWEEEGRPTNFDPDVELALDDRDPADFRRFQAKLEEMLRGKDA